LICKPNDDLYLFPFHLSRAKESEELSAQGGDGEPCEPYYLERCDERTIIYCADETEKRLKMLMLALA